MTRTGREISLPAWAARNLHFDKLATHFNGKQMNAEDHKGSVADTLDLNTDPSWL
jgi:hypothetical protein